FMSVMRQIQFAGSAGDAASPPRFSRSPRRGRRGPSFQIRQILQWAAFSAGIWIAGACNAENAHDLYFCVNLSAQGLVMGGPAAVASGLYRSNDRQNFEHVGFNHFRTFSMTSDPRSPTRLFVSVLDGILRTPDRGKSWRRVTGWEMTEPK